MALLNKFTSKSQQMPERSQPKAKHAMHELKDFVFSPVGLAFTIGLILAVHWFSTRETKEK